MKVGTGRNRTKLLRGHSGLVLSFDLFFSERVGIGTDLRGPFRFRDHFLGPVKSSSAWYLFVMNYDYDNDLSSSDLTSRHDNQLLSVFVILSHSFWSCHVNVNKITILHICIYIVLEYSCLHL